MRRDRPAGGDDGRGRRRRLAILVVLGVAWVASGFVCTAVDGARADDEARALRRRLEVAAREATPAEVDAAIGDALLGDFRRADALLPAEGQVETRPRVDRLEAHYRTEHHRPERCFVLTLRPRGSTVSGGEEC